MASVRYELKLYVELKKIMLWSVNYTIYMKIMHKILPNYHQYSYKYCTMILMTMMLLIIIHSNSHGLWLLMQCVM